MKIKIVGIALLILAVLMPIPVLRANQLRVPSSSRVF